MNKRQKKKRIRIGSTAKQRRSNKALCKRYPFLIPRNVFSDQISWEMDWKPKEKKYSYTLADDFPRGWWKAFGLMLCEELREELLKFNYLKKYRFVQIKEKYGALRAYDNGAPKGCNVPDIIGKYSTLSENICIICGFPDVPMIDEGWISPECFDCFYKRYKRYNPNMTDDEIITRYNKYVCSTDNKMSNKYTYIKYNKDGKTTYEKDISGISETIREAWNGRKN